MTLLNIHNNRPIATTTDNTPQTNTAKTHTANHTTISLINRQYMQMKWSARVIHVVTFLERNATVESYLPYIVQETAGLISQMTVRYLLFNKIGYIARH